MPRLGGVNRREERAADLVVAAEDPVREDGHLAPGLTAPGRDEQRRRVEQRRGAAGVRVRGQGHHHRAIERVPSWSGEAQRFGGVATRRESQQDRERRQRDEAQDGVVPLDRPGEAIGPACEVQQPGSNDHAEGSPSRSDSARETGAAHVLRDRHRVDALEARRAAPWAAAEDFAVVGVALSAASDSTPRRGTTAWSSGREPRCAIAGWAALGWRCR